MPHQFRVLIPVQDLGSALPRMEVSSPVRRELALAFARDTVTAAVRSQPVGEVVVISRDDQVRAAFGAEGLEVQPAIASRMVSSVVAAAHFEAGERAPLPTAVLMGDLPALLPTELSAALRRVFVGARSVYAEDMFHGGTTFFASRHRDDFAPRLGARSGWTNAELGAMRIGTDLAGLRCDVDTVEDLKLAKYLGVGRHTAYALERHPQLRALKLAA